MRFVSTRFVALASAFATITTMQAHATQAQVAPARYSTATTPLSKLLADPAAKAIIDARIPGMTKQHGLMFVKGKSLKEIQAISKGGITDDQLSHIDADFSRLK